MMHLHISPRKVTFKITQPKKWRTFGSIEFQCDSLLNSQYCSVLFHGNKLRENTSTKLRHDTTICLLFFLGGGAPFSHFGSSGFSQWSLKKNMWGQSNNANVWWYIFSGHFMTPVSEGRKQWWLHLTPQNDYDAVLVTYHDNGFWGRKVVGCELLVVKLCWWFPTKKSIAVSGSLKRWLVIYNHPIGSIYHLYTTYILPIGWLYATYHLLSPLKKCLPKWEVFNKNDISCSKQKLLESERLDGIFKNNPEKIIWSFQTSMTLSKMLNFLGCKMHKHILQKTPEGLSSIIQSSRICLGYGPLSGKWRFSFLQKGPHPRYVYKQQFALGGPSQFSKRLVTLICKPCRLFGRGTSLLRGTY